MIVYIDIQIIHASTIVHNDKGWGTYVCITLHTGTYE